MDWNDASRAAYILHLLAKMIEGSSFEQRIEALEQAAAQDQPAGRRANGQFRPGARH